MNRMFEFFKGWNQKGEKEDETLEAKIEKTRLEDEARHARYEEMEKKHAEITKELDKPEVEEKSHQISDMWSSSISMTLNKPIFAEKDNSQIDHDNEIDKLIQVNGKELAEYLLEKKRRLDEAGVWPSKDDKFTAYALFQFGLLKENLWPSGGNQVSSYRPRQ